MNYTNAWLRKAILLYGEGMERENKEERTGRVNIFERC